MKRVALAAKRVLALVACLTVAVAVASCDETDGAGNATDDTAPSQIDSAGRQIFQQRCAACHVPTAEQNRVGPHLVGIFGRPAGTVEGFRYSDAMRGSGIVWTEETMVEYLRAPRDYIPGNRMAFAGLARDADIQAVLSYLQTVTVPQGD